MNEENVRVLLRGRSRYVAWNGKQSVRVWKREKVAKGRRVKAIGFCNKRRRVSSFVNGASFLLPRLHVGSKSTKNDETYGKEPVEREQEILDVLIEESSLYVCSIRLRCS